MTGHLVYDADCGSCTRSAHGLDEAPVTATRHRMPGGTAACRITPPAAKSEKKPENR